MSKDNVKAQILSLVSEADIIRFYFPSFKEVKANFKNPLADKDNAPSLNWYKDGTQWKFKAHNTGEQGDIWQYVSELYKLDCKGQFNEVCNRIITDLNLSIEHTESNPTKVFNVTNLREPNENFYKFWEHWKVDKDTLLRYQVKQVAQLQNGKNIFNYAQGVVISYLANGRYKVYIPGIAENEKWTKGKDGKHTKKLYKNQINTDIFGVANIKPGEDVFICEGEKDTLVLAAKGFNAICFQSATAKPTAVQIESIKKEAANVFVCYDTDEAGKVGASWLNSQYGLRVINLPEKVKDIADYFQAANTDDFKLLIQLATNPVENKKGAELLNQIRQIYKLPKFDKDGNINDIKIKQVAFYDLINSFGFYVFEKERQICFVKVEKNIVEQVSEGSIQSYFFAQIETLPEIIDDNVSILDIKETLYKQNQTLFSTQKLSLLKRIEKDFCTDTKESVYLFFRNGFVKVQKDKWELLDYSKLEGLVWKNQVVDRDFQISEKPNVSLKNAGIFSQYLYNVSGQNERRLQVLCTIIGYTLHYYFAVQRRAVLLTDSKIEGENNGRTGKSILIKAIEEIKPTTRIDGKKWDSEKFPYQEVTQQTQIIVLDDVKQNFSIEPLFNDITDKVKVEQKGKTPFSLVAKFLIASNRPIKIEGASARGRVVEFEFSEYYSDTFGAVHEFGKMFFTEDFTNEDWNDFYNVMCYCIKHYFETGLQIPENKNLSIRKLINETNEDFVEWMDNYIKEGKIEDNCFIDKKVLHEDFLQSYPDYKENKYLKQQRFFTDYLKKYISFSGLFEPFNKEIDVTHSGSTHSIKFRYKTVEIKRLELV